MSFEEQYNQLIAKWGKTERKGKANPYTSHNGHMFSFIDKKQEYLAIRLGKEEQTAFMEKYKTGPVIQYNSTMRGYVEVPKEMFADYEVVKIWLDKSWEYINSLEPQPSKKKK
ncbi:hypothetical protein K6119_04045 [Paracrocinitomix mangrovi]|uniref:hypothetical protein n=1 Tax=Paracrocinitomix mangrovi TaxID=2862509 RepID=UPI001C8D716D|nr:hypothetical protein [Paracrocinitomix mangrovi]UKN02684.1 hypothetical protein K6119_04045 [Paracrocinitomix mangrovi]